MNRSVSLLIGAAVIMMAALIVLTVFNDRINIFGEQGNTASEEIGCQQYQQSYITGEAGEEEIPERCIDSELERKRTVSEALSGLG